MNQFLISQQLAQAILNYLARQPYAEVMEMIAGLQQLQAVPDGSTNGPLEPVEGEVVDG